MQLMMMNYSCGRDFSALLYPQKPSLAELSKMPRQALSRIEDFKIGRIDVGEIAFLEPVDVEGIDFDRLVTIEKGKMSVYAGVDKPAAGAGLNKPALLTFKRMMPKSKDANSQAEFHDKLVKAAARMGALFVHYEPSTGTWVIKINHF